jgi:hypothetical protein
MLLIGIIFVLNSVVLLLWLPRYQRKVEAGKTQRVRSAPPLRTLRRAAIGLLIVGVIMIAGWYFKLDDF